ncbi:MAG: SAM-dependent methyltransferase [bacterium]
MDSIKHWVTQESYKRRENIGGLVAPLVVAAAEGFQHPFDRVHEAAAVFSSLSARLVQDSMRTDDPKIQRWKKVFLGLGVVAAGVTAATNPLGWVAGGGVAGGTLLARVLLRKEKIEKTQERYAPDAECDQVDWAKDILINDRKLAKELERASNKCPITYAEFIEIIQNGRNGYHAKNKFHGGTCVDKTSSSLVVEAARKHRVDTIIEFGAGNGKLMRAVIEKFSETSVGQYIGIEILKGVRKEFLRAKPNSNLAVKAVAAIEEVQQVENGLVLFPYSLDCIPPYLFTRTGNGMCPDKMVGIKVVNGRLSEVMLSDEQMRSKGMVLQNGILRDGNESYDLRSWNLEPNQRAYIPIGAFSTIRKVVEKVNNPTVLIIDEAADGYGFRNDDLGGPLEYSPRHHTIRWFDIEPFYKLSGDRLLYFPLPSNAVANFLNSMGFNTVVNTKETSFSLASPRYESGRRASERIHVIYATDHN